ncbi:hypothetical protein GGE07_001062 [Sinorhizobium terangae]|nr:hypothetical protein [Sinorhizobium terangae]
MASIWQASLARRVHRSDYFLKDIHAFATLNVPIAVFMEVAYVVGMVMVSFLCALVAPVFDDDEPSWVILVGEEFVSQVSVFLPRGFGDNGQIAANLVFSALLGVEHSNNVDFRHCSPSSLRAWQVAVPAFALTPPDRRRTGCRRGLRSLVDSCESMTD